MRQIRTGWWLATMLLTLITLDVVRADRGAAPPAPDAARHGQPATGQPAGRQPAGRLPATDAEAPERRNLAAQNALLARHDEAALLKRWHRALPGLREELVAKLDAGDTLGLYEVQLRTSAVLQWAASRGNVAVLRSLATLYARTFPYATEHGLMDYYYVHEPDGAKPKRTSTVRQPRGTRAWIPAGEDGDPGPESVLQSSQFLYGVARLVRALADADVPVATFDAEAWSLLSGHLGRWIFPDDDAAGAFQRTGWGCGWGSFGHAAHVRNLMARRYGTQAMRGVSSAREPAGYCNMVTDVDLFVIAAAGEALLANRRDPDRFALPDARRDRLAKYVESGLELVGSRLSRTSVELPDGSDVKGLVFDRGIGDTYPDKAYAGDVDPSFPGWTKPGEAPARPPRPAEGLGWDLSHARRFVLFGDTAAALEARGVVESPVGEADLRALAVQTVLGTWNGDPVEPLFANYVDGTDGWYRVNYADRPGYGIAPHAFSDRMVGMGYGYWGCANPRIRDVILKRAIADEADPVSAISLDRFRAQWTASILMSSCR